MLWPTLTSTTCGEFYLKICHPITPSHLFENWKAMLALVFMVSWTGQIIPLNVHKILNVDILVWRVLWEAKKSHCKNMSQDVLFYMLLWTTSISSATFSMLNNVHKMILTFDRRFYESLQLLAVAHTKQVVVVFFCFFIISTVSSFNTFVNGHLLWLGIS